MKPANAREPQSRNKIMRPSELASESEIQKGICEYLTLRGIFHWRVNTGGGKYAGKAGKEYHVRFGFPGVADIIGIAPYWIQDERISFDPLAKGEYAVGRFLAIEVKQPSGKLTLDQEAFRIAVQENGGLYILARSVEDVQRALGSDD